MNVAIKSITEQRDFVVSSSSLKEVQYMDSSGISVLIESHQKATELGTKVVLKEISKSVLKVIMMAKLEQILNLD